MKSIRKRGLALVLGLSMILSGFASVPVMAEENIDPEAAAICSEAETETDFEGLTSELLDSADETADLAAETEIPDQAEAAAETVLESETVFESETELESGTLAESEAESESETELESETETEEETEDEEMTLLLQSTAEAIYDHYGVDRSVDLTEELADYSEEELNLIQSQAVTASQNEPIIFDFIINKMGLNVASACGILANFAGESSFRANGIEGNYLKSYRCSGELIDEDEFAAMVDSGQISREEFICSDYWGASAAYWSEYRGDSSYVGHYGYGLLQWTTESEKGGLYDYCKAHGYSIASLQAQLEYMEIEMKTVKQYTNAYYKSTGIQVIKYANGYYKTGFIWLYDSFANTYHEDVPNTEDGAADAAVKFACWHVGSATYNYDVRAERARTEYWPEYRSFVNGYAVEDELVIEFVTRLYQICLDRNPDTAGLQKWSDQLSSGSKSGIQVAYGFIFSSEFKKKNYCNEHFVDSLYLAFMGRTADTKGKASWVAQLDKGKTREAVFNGFAQSSEFTKLCQLYGITRGTAIAVPAKGTVASGSCAACARYEEVEAFVSRLYGICLNRNPDPAGLNDWTKKLVNKIITGEKAAYGFFFSAEFQNKKYSNREFVTYLYNALFGRSPDSAGLNNWLKKLESGTSRTKVFYGFTGSSEFKNLCEEYGITAR